MNRADRITSYRVYCTTIAPCQVLFIQRGIATYLFVCLPLYFIMKHTQTHSREQIARDNHKLMSNKSQVANVWFVETQTHTLN